MFFLLLIYVILILWAYLAYKANQLKRNKSKSPPLTKHYIPIIGNLHYFLFGDNAHFLVSSESLTQEILSQEGRIHRAILGPKTFYIVADPEDCFTIANSCFSKPQLPYGFLNNYLGSGIFTELDGGLWKSSRKVLNPAFNQHMLEEFLFVFNDEARNFVKNLKKHVGNGPFNQNIYSNQLTLETVVRTVFDITEEDKETKDKIIKDSSRLFELAALRITNIYLWSDFIYNLTALGREERKNINRVNKLSEEIIEKTKILMKKDLNNKHLSDRKFKPIVNILLDLEDSGVFTRKDLLCQLNTMIAGGFHTTGFMLTVILCAIGTYPKVQDRIYTELLEVLGQSDRDVEYKDLPKLVYLEAVLKEALRLYPITPGILRFGDQAVRLKEYTIPKNSFYILLINATNRLQVWGKDREIFKPERWLNPATLPKNAHAFLSFSIGRRACIGRTYAMNFLKATCVHMLRHYKIKSDIRKLQLRLDFFYSFHSGHEISIEKRL